MKVTRYDLIHRAGVQLQDVRQLFRDVDHWNKEAAQRGELPIEKDPDGSLAKIEEALQSFIAKETEKIRLTVVRTRPLQAPILFFWLQEESEIWAAHSLEQFAAYVRAHILDPQDWPRFEPEDEGETWGCFDRVPAGKIQQEQGDPETYLEAAMSSPELPAQLSTQYN